MNPYFLLICLLLTFSFNAQDFSSNALQKMGDEELLSLFDLVDTDSIKAEKVARAYLNKARIEKDTIKMARGYDRLARIFHDEKSVQLADSIIYLTKNFENITYPALGYMFKGILYFKNEKYKKSLDNLLIAYDYYVKNGNVINQIFVNKLIINIKCIWGNPAEALELSKEHLNFIKSVNFAILYNLSARKSYKPKPQEHLKEFKNEYIDALTLVSEAYLYSKKYDSALINVKKGIKKSMVINDVYKYQYLVSCSGEIQFYLKNYNKAIDSLKKSSLLQSKPTYLLNDYYYLGLSYLYKGEKEIGINYLLKADSIFDLTKKIIPNQSLLHYELFKFYKVIGDKEKQIIYLSKIIYTDSIIKKNYQYIDSKIKDKYEIPKLIVEKESLIKSLGLLNKKKSTTIVLVLSFLSLSLLILGYYVNRQRVYKKRFKSLVSQNETNIGHRIVVKPKREISKEIFNTILEQLDYFEKEQKYLSLSINLQGMAKAFRTNHNYLSKVINLNKGKHFSRYINDLRTSYAFNELKVNKRLRNYTIKAIAKECGFKSGESFSKAFLKNYGFSPSFYLKQLEKNKQ